MSLFSGCFANADGNFVHQYAVYVTTSHAKNDSTEVYVGKSSLELIGFDDKTQRYTVQIENTDAKGVVQKKISQIESEEINSQNRGDFYAHCADADGHYSTPVRVKRKWYSSCEIDSSNIQFFTGNVPFTILKTVSVSADGTVFTTKLTDFSRF